MRAVCESVSAPAALAELLSSLLNSGEASASARVAVGWADTPLGTLLLATTDDGLCFAEFAEPERLAQQIRSLRRYFGGPVVQGDHVFLTQARKELAEYFAGGRTEFEVPLALAGTSFQRSVWDHLRRIPYGATVSYEALAQAVGVPKGQRAVGRANGQNRMCVFVPCHRVINKDGGLGGYGGSLWRKKYLLQLEGSSQE